MAAKKRLTVARQQDHGHATHSKRRIKMAKHIAVATKSNTLDKTPRCCCGYRVDDADIHYTESEAAKFNLSNPIVCCASAEDAIKNECEDCFQVSGGIDTGVD